MIFADLSNTRSSLAKLVWMKVSKKKRIVKSSLLGGIFLPKYFVLNLSFFNYSTNLAYAFAYLLAKGLRVSRDSY